MKEDPREDVTHGGLPLRGAEGYRLLKSGPLVRVRLIS